MNDEILTAEVPAQLSPKGQANWRLLRDRAEVHRTENLQLKARIKDDAELRKAMTLELSEARTEIAFLNGKLKETRTQLLTLQDTDAQFADQMIADASRFCAGVNS